MNIEKFVTNLSKKEALQLMQIISQNKTKDLHKCLKNRFSNTRKDFNNIVSGKTKDFGIPDILGGIYSYFPCEFVEILDEDMFLIKVYEPGTKQYHVVDVGALTIDD